MSHKLCRTLAILVLAPSLALSTIPPPEHVHESDGDHPQVGHRHVEPHQVAPHNQRTAEIDHGGGHVVWLDDIAASQSTYRLPMPAARLSDRVDLIQALPAEWIATSVNDAAPAHGPPRLIQSLRAPPISAC